MTTNHSPVATATGMSPLTTAKFGPGMLLQDDDLEQLSKYTQELSRLMMRSLFGCGVVCGLVVSTDTRCGLVIKVADGLALDCCGDPVQVPQPMLIPVNPGCDPDFPKHLWVVLCGKRKCCAPRAAMCSTDDEESPSVCTRERYAFEIRVLRARPVCVCGCPEPKTESKDTPQGLMETQCKCVNPELECYVDHYAGKCKCSCADCSDCDCDCILLARLDNTGDQQYPKWAVDHRVRRFVRPVLIEDPQVRIEHELAKAQQIAAAPAPAGAVALASAPGQTVV